MLLSQQNIFPKQDKTVGYYLTSGPLLEKKMIFFIKAGDSFKLLRYFITVGFRV